MNYGFVIDNNKCFGCHACSTACKSENEVPLGVNRTWVKYVETGMFPNSRRHFQVTRCNHCENPPCVRICPVTAMYQRDDGIVEFDSEVCIGCKACMQACPYDAIYIDPDSHTAAKCHFCSHRLDIGLEPACIVVCPAHAIIGGDMENPLSEISRVLASNQVTVRKPEQGTAPKLYYIGGESAVMHPTATERIPDTYLWADVIPLHKKNGDHHTAAEQGQTFTSNKTSPSGEDLRVPQTQGLPASGPIQRGGRMSEHMIQVSYNAQHKIPWHWPVPAYLTTKGIGAGLFMLLSMANILNIVQFDPLTYLVGGFLSMLFIAITTGLLVVDLERPAMFLTIVFRPQMKSWLARGAFILMGFSAVVGMWWLAELGAYLSWWGVEVISIARPVGMWSGLVLSFGAAIYTAFLFGQAEGRDLWQSSLLPAHLIVQSIMVAAGVLAITALAIPVPEDIISFATVAFVSALIADLIVTLIGEFGMPHASEIAATAAHEISHGKYKQHFWLVSILVGHLVPLGLIALNMPVAAAVAGVCAVIGLYLFEYAFVMAPQEIPNS